MSSSMVSQGKYTLLSKLSTPIFAFLLLIIIGRESDLMLGQYAIAMTYYFVLQILPLFGLTPYLMREAAKYPEKVGMYMVNIGGISMLGCLALLLIVQAILPLTNYSMEMVASIEIVTYAVFPGILTFIAEVLLVAISRAKPASLIVVAENAIRLVASLFVLHTGGGIEAIFWVLLWTKIVSLLVFAAYFIYCRNEIAQASRPNLVFLNDVIKVIPVFFINTLLYVVVGRLDFFVLSFFETPEKIAFYAISYRLLEISMVAVSAICMVLLPKFSLLNHNHPRYFLAVSRTVILYFTLLVFFISLGGTLFAYEYVKWFFPTQFDKPVLLSVFFSGIIFICAVDYCLSIILHSSNQERTDLKAIAIGALVYALCLFLLVPSYGGLGAFAACAIVPLIQMAAKIKLSSFSLMLSNNMRHTLIVITILSVTILIAQTISEHGFFFKVVALFGLSLSVYGMLTAFGVLKLKRQLRFISRVFGVSVASKQKNNTQFSATEVTL